jgi:hypothetical protein
VKLFGEVFNSLEDAFNPTVNQLWREHRLDYLPNLGQKATVGVTEAVIKEVFQKENVKKYAHLYFGHWTSNYEYSYLRRSPGQRERVQALDAALQKFIDMVPDELSYLLAFVILRQADNNYLNIDGYYHKVTQEYALGDGTDRACIETATGRITPFTRNMNEADLPGLFKEWLLKLKKHVDKFFKEQTLKYPYDDVLFNKNIVYTYSSNLLFDFPVYPSAVGNGRPMKKASEFDDGMKYVFEWMEAECSFRVRYNIQITKENRTALHTLLPRETNVLNLLPWPETIKGEFQPRLYGVELEVSTAYEISDIVDAPEKPVWACKHDGSITGKYRNRVEIVSVPMSLKAHRKYWMELFTKLSYQKFDTTTETGNGFHVHIAKDAFYSEKHLQNFTWFLTSHGNRSFILKVSERTEAALNRWSPFPNLPGESKTLDHAYIVQYASNVRGVLNVHQKGPTFEVRLFQGIVSYAAVIKNLEFVDSIFEFTKDCGWRDCTLRNYIAWMEKLPKKRYSVLKRFFAEFDMSKYLIDNDLREAYYMETDPVRIVEKVSKSGIKITQEHVSRMNKLEKARKFVLKEGRLAVADPPEWYYKADADVMAERAARFRFANR